MSRTLSGENSGPSQENGFRKRKTSSAKSMDCMCVYQAGLVLREGHLLLKLASLLRGK